MDIKQERKMKERNKEALICFLQSGHANVKIPSKCPVPLLSIAIPTERLLQIYYIRAYIT
jgi:hypothetical protein